MPRGLLKYLRSILLGVAGLFFIRPSYACSVCFGAGDSASTTGLKIAILTMLAILSCVFIGIIAFFLQLKRRARLSFQSTHIAK